MSRGHASPLQAWRALIRAAALAGDDTARLMRQPRTGPIYPPKMKMPIATPPIRVAAAGAKRLSPADIPLPPGPAGGGRMLGFSATPLTMMMPALPGHGRRLIADDSRSPRAVSSFVDGADRLTFFRAAAATDASFALGAAFQGRRHSYLMPGHFLAEGLEPITRRAPRWQEFY